MSNDWEWDTSLFKGTAAFYTQGRMPYAPGLVAAIEAAMGQRGGRLIDVGCGPGTLSVALAPLFDEVIGLDPDPEMVDVARQLVAASGHTNVQIIQARGEELPAGLGVVRAAAFAQSFHWMDRDRVAATVFGMLEPGGVLLHINEVKGEPPQVSGPNGEPPPPYAAGRELLVSYLGPVRRAGQGKLEKGTPDGEATIFARAGFEGPEWVLVPGGNLVVRDVDQIVAWVHSRSDGACHLFGDRLDEFDAELRALLLAESPTGAFVEPQPDTELYIWRKPG